jgi:hypothetical protein
MKRTIIIIACLIILTSGLTASYLPQTKTMSSEQFSALFNAIDYADGHDEVMRFYWDKIVQNATPNPTSRYESDDDWREERATYEPINWSSTYAKNSLIGALAVDPFYSQAQAFLDGVKDYLIYNPEPGHHDDYLDLNEVWREFRYIGDPEEGHIGYENNDDFLLSRLMVDCAYILDMLWFYLDDSPNGEREQMIAVVDNLANYAYIVIAQPNINGDFYNLGPASLPSNAYWDVRYPSFFSTDTNNHRTYLTASLGFVGCVLGNSDYVTTAEDDLFSPTLYNGHNGLFGLNLSPGGIYAESFTYGDLVAEQVGLFFSARNRVEIDGFTKNWYEDSEDVRNFFEESYKMITPDFGGISFEDSDLQLINDNNGELTKIFINSSQLLNYYGTTRFCVRTCLNFLGKRELKHDNSQML